MSSPSLTIVFKGLVVLCTVLQSDSAWFANRCPYAAARRSGGHRTVGARECLCRGALPSLSASTQEGNRKCGDAKGDRTQASGIAAPCMPRRSFVDACATAPMIAFAMRPAVAVEEEASTLPTTDDESSSASNVARNRVANWMHAVPTFCIVDPKGVPYVVVGEDAKVTGYFFTRYEEADRILKLARASADRAIKSSDEKNVVNPWKSARISSVPLDVAATLVTKTLSSRTHFQVAPAESDIEGALNITGKPSLSEGKVPLFYYEDWKDANNQSLLFFGRDQLEQSYMSSESLKGKTLLPQPNVTELFAVLTQVVQNPNDAELQNLVLVAPEGSAVKARECERRSGGKEPPFVVGQQILVL